MARATRAPASRQRGQVSAAGIFGAPDPVATRRREETRRWVMLRAIRRGLAAKGAPDERAIRRRAARTLAVRMVEAGYALPLDVQLATGVGG